MDKRFNLPGSNISFVNYDRITIHTQPGVTDDYPLPFIIINDRYTEFIPREHTRSLEEAAALAEGMLTNRIIREFDFAADIIDKQVNFYETPEGLLVDALITTNERIDKAVPIGMGEPGHPTSKPADESVPSENPPSA